MRITASQVMTSVPVRIMYPQQWLQFMDDGTHRVMTTMIPATLAKGDGGIFATLDYTMRNDNIYRVWPTDTFETEN